MAINTVRVQINGTWVTLTKNLSTGKYEGTIAAPSITSYNVNAGHYYPVTAEATDLAGNVTVATDTHTTLGANLKLFVKEVTKPTISITAPASGSYLATNTPTITLQLRDEANGSGIKISSLSIKIDNETVITNTSPGVTVTSVSGGFNVSYIPQTALSDGAHTVLVNVQDNDGNSANPTTRTFTVDTVPPVLNINNPSEATTYKNQANITVVGVTNDITSSSVSIKIKLNSGIDEIVEVDTNGNFSKELTLIEGTNTVTVIATDLAGKTSTVTRTIILDTVVPIISKVTISPNPINVGQSYVVTVEVSD